MLPYSRDWRECRGCRRASSPIPVVTLSTSPPQPGPPQHCPCSLLGCPFTQLQDTAQVPAPASSLLLLGHHPHLAQTRSEVVHRHPSPPAGQGTAEQAPAPHKKSKPARCSCYQLLPEHQSKISPLTRVLSERQSQEKQQQPQL